VNSVVTHQGLLVSGEWSLLGSQVVAVLCTYAVAVVGTLVCLAVARAVTGGLRVNEDDEFAGLDLSQHSENAYVFGTGGYGGGGQEMFAQRPAMQQAAMGVKAMGS